MRFVDRTKLSPPEILFSKRVEEARGEVQEFLEQTDTKGGTRRAPSSDWLTQDTKLVEHMHADFGGTCAYCERATGEMPYVTLNGLVSHHRPESLAQDEHGNTELKAYSWLMYDWENLLWICRNCQRRKGNLFYVEGKRGEPGMPIKALRESEGELFLDPCFHDPAEHLSFQIDGTLNWKTEQGHATSETLELNGAELIMLRRKRISTLIIWLMDSRDIVSAFSTGGRSPESAFVLKATHDDFSFEHLGAATLALLGFARMRGMEVATGEDLLKLLNGLDDRNRRAFLDDALKANQVDREARSSGEIDIDTTPAPPRPAPKRRNRIPNIHRLPTALSTITGVEISNFKALHDIAFDLPASVEDTRHSPCMLLLGENATGKSSVLEAMTLAVIGSHEAKALDLMLPDEELEPSDLIHRPDPSEWDKPAPGMAVRLTFLDHRAPVGLTAKPGDSVFSGSDTCAKVILGYGPRRYFTNRQTRRFRAPAYRVRSLFDPMDMIPNPIHWLSELDGKAFEAAARVLRVILMLDNEDDFERDDDPDTRGTIFISQNGQRTALKDLSVGYKSVIAMACDIIRELLYHFDNVEFAHAIVFVDEIETHLHPRWKMRIMQLLREAFPKVQFIVTTHDPLCLRGMYDGEVFVLQRGGEDAQVEKVEDLPAIRGMRAEQILTSEFFGLGSTDPETDAQLARYNILAARIEDLSDTERAELEGLRERLDDNMVIGTTLAEQAYAAALKDQNARQSVNPTKAPSPRRSDLKTRFAALFDEAEP